MRWEYLAFDALVGIPPIIASIVWRRQIRTSIATLVVACLFVAIPFVIWDALVTGRHWWFDERYTLGVRALGLPVEEILFFFVVPYACIFTWDTLIDTKPVETIGRSPYSILYAAGLLGIGLFALGYEYTGLSLMAVGVCAGLDSSLGTQLFRQRRYWWFVGLVLGLTLIFNTYLTWRPVVHYDDSYRLFPRVGTIPLEDFVYGVANVSGVAVVYSWMRGWALAPSWLARLIERRLGGYRQTLVKVDPSLPANVTTPTTVAVIGGGLAGISAAALLSDRGFKVTLIEKQPHLGGKIGGWTETLPDGFEVNIDHGFHAFFAHYYNLQDFLERLGLRRTLRPVERYLILTRDRRELSFPPEPSPPVLNLLGLWRRGLYSLREVAFGPAGRKMEALLRYDENSTFAEFDKVSFQRFADDIQLPADLRVVFNSFARAFFSDHDRLSTAELIKSFHYYYLSHDQGLAYDYVEGNYAQDFLPSIQRFLSDRNVEQQLSTSVDAIERSKDTLLIDGRAFDHVVVATDVGAARTLLRESPIATSEDPQLVSAMQHMKPGQRYAVLRVWLSKQLGEDFPAFVATERIEVLDAFSICSKYDQTCRKWAQTNRGTVLELHCYAVPDAVETESRIRRLLLEDMEHYLPSLKGTSIVHEHMQVRNDFTAFHLGMAKHRPSTETQIRGLCLAGDWVRLPCPAMLMEAAHTSGRLAANSILREHGLAPYPVDTVPTRGILAGPDPERRASVPPKSSDAPKHPSAPLE